MPTRLAAAFAFLLGVIVSAEAGATVTVGQHGMVFTKSSASLAKGDRMVFTNEDDVIHNIHIFGPGPDESTDLGLQKPGSTLTYKFAKSGSYRIRCNIHPAMRMTVAVN